MENKLEQDQQLLDIVKQFEDFLDATEPARLSSEEARDYRDHKQWSEEEKAKIEVRGQAPIVTNYISRKVNALVGLESQKRTDPKAFPRTPQHEKDADSITDALRYVADNNDFDEVSSDVFENEIVEGYGGVAVEIEIKNNNFEIMLNHFTYDRYYYDHHSRRRDFADIKYNGLVVWMDFDDVVMTWPDKKEHLDFMISSSFQSDQGETFEDKPLWIDRERKRVRVLQHYFIHRGVWNVAFLTNSIFLTEPKQCPYVDEFGDPENPLIAQSAYITRDNERYGEVRGMIDIQDEINHRRSKALHLLSQRQTFGTQTAVPDVQKAKEELAKPDGHLEVQAGELNKDFGVLPTGDMAQGQFALLEEAKQELDASSINPALTGADDKSISGRSREINAQGGMIQLEYLFKGHRAWKKRVYRQVWNRIKQFWDAERWIRVTDDENNLRFVGLNQPFTLSQALQDKIEDKEDPEHKHAAILLEQMEIDQDPRLEQQMGIKNNVAEIDVDIILDEGPDVITIQQEQFGALLELAKIYGPEAVPFESVVELSGLRNKERFLDKSKGNEISEEEQQIQQTQFKMQIEAAVADLDKKKGDARKANSEADQKDIENAIILSNPSQTDVSI